jgi:hypothetical protein
MSEGAVIKLILLALLATNPADKATYKPVHMMQSNQATCGATERFLKEKVKVVLSYHRVYVNGDAWDYQGHNDAGYFVAQFQVRRDQYMSMQLDFDTEEAYLTISGIDAKRRPCEDTVYLKRVK